jgi:hypothetical protein
MNLKSNPHTMYALNNQNHALRIKKRNTQASVSPFVYGYIIENG